MSSTSAQKPSSEGSSTLVDTCESTPYLQTIFQEFTPNSQKLDPRKYKVVKYENENVTAVISEIDDILDQQQSSSVFVGDIVIIIYDGTSIEQQVLKHLREIEVRFTCLSGPSNCLILTIALAPHEGGTLFFYSSLHETIFRIRDRFFSDVLETVKVKIRDELWKIVAIGQVKQTPEQTIAQLQTLRQVLSRTIKTLLPALPDQPLNVLNGILYGILTKIQISLQKYEALESLGTSLGNLLPNMLQQLREELPNGPRNYLRDLVQPHMASEELMAVPTGSFQLPIFVHSARTICSRVFEDGEVRTVTGVLKKKKWDADFYGTKIPDYTICPGYLGYIRSAQNEQLVPSVTVEVGMDDSTVKVILDCLFTVLGTRFQIDGAYGVDLQFDKAKKVLEHIDIFHFDVSLEALVKIKNDLSGKEQATVSLVIAQKALLKYNDLRALQLLREWKKSGVADDDEYQKVCDRICGLKVDYLLPHGSVQLGEQDQPSKAAAMDMLKLYESYPDDMLQKEMGKYGQLVVDCNNLVDQYWGPERNRVDEMHYHREGEITLIHQIFQRKEVIHLDERSAQSMQFRIKDYTGISLLEEETISLFPEKMMEIFRRISLTFLDSSLDDIEVNTKRERPAPIYGSPESSQVPYKSYDDIGEEYGDCSDTNEPEASTAGAMNPSSQGPLRSRKRSHPSSPSSGQGQGEGGILVRTLRSGAEYFGRKMRKISGPSAAQDELPEEVSEILDSMLFFKRWRVKPILLEKSVRSQLRDVVEDKVYFKGFKHLMGKELSIIRDILSFPELLLQYLVLQYLQAEIIENQRSGRTN